MEQQTAQEDEEQVKHQEEASNHVDSGSEALHLVSIGTASIGDTFRYGFRCSKKNDGYQGPSNASKQIEYGDKLSSSFKVTAAAEPRLDGDQAHSSKKLSSDGWLKSTAQPP